MIRLEHEWRRSVNPFHRDLNRTVAAFPRPTTTASRSTGFVEYQHSEGVLLLVLRSGCVPVSRETAPFRAMEHSGDVSLAEMDSGPVAA